MRGMGTAQGGRSPEINNRMLGSKKLQSGRNCSKRRWQVERNMVTIDSKTFLHNPLQFGALVHILSPDPHSSLFHDYFLFTEKKLRPKELQGLAKVPDSAWGRGRTQRKLLSLRALSATPPLPSFTSYLQGILFSNLNLPSPKILSSLRKCLRCWMEMLHK